MHSSTSNSNERIPTGGWPGTWLSALAIVVLLVAGWEWFIRERGLGDVAVANTAELWMQERARAGEYADEALILVGASRMQGGLDLDELRRASGLRPVQLAITGSPLLPVLRHLAADRAITGTIVVSLDMAGLRVAEKDSDAETWIRAYDDFEAGRTAVYYQPIEDRLRRAADSALVSFARNARPHQLLRGNTTRSYVRTLPDRSQQFDYSTVDRDAAYQRRLELVLGGEEPEYFAIPGIERRFAEIERLVSQLQRRGVDVVFVRFPSSGRIREVEELLYPRDKYWDPFSNRTSARTLHFADHPELAEFDLPDGIHLDVSDQKAFTRTLAALLFKPTLQGSDPRL